MSGILGTLQTVGAFTARFARAAHSWQNAAVWKGGRAPVRLHYEAKTELAAAPACVKSLLCVSGRSSRR